MIRSIKTCSTYNFDLFFNQSIQHSGGFHIVVSIFNQSVSRMVFRAWRAVAVDARKTREYFERLERGELDDDMDMEYGASTENYRFLINYL